MIVINSSIPKSASALIYNYQRHIVRNAQERRGHNLIDMSSGSYGFYNRINLKSFFFLIYLNLRYGDVAIKTHGGPNLFIRALINSGVGKATFSYRDPRDVILSAFDHGERSRKGLDPTMAFHEITNLEESLRKVKIWTRYWYGWKRYNKVLFIRYEEFIEDKLNHLKQFVDYLGYELNDDQIMKIYNFHEKIKEKFTTFNKGTKERYKTEMSEEFLKLCNSTLSRILIDMGYEV